MHSQLFTMDPRVPGFAHGFQEYYINGQRIIGHFGVLDAFYSSLMLIPEQDLGWFIVYNGDKSPASPGDFLITFLNHYFPTEPYAAPTPPSDFCPESQPIHWHLQERQNPSQHFQQAHQPQRRIRSHQHPTWNNTPEGHRIRGGGTTILQTLRLIQPLERQPTIPNGLQRTTIRIQRWRHLRKSTLVRDSFLHLGPRGSLLGVLRFNPDNPTLPERT